MLDEAHPEACRRRVGFVVPREYSTASISRGNNINGCSTIKFQGNHMFGGSANS